MNEETLEVKENWRWLRIQLAKLVMPLLQAIVIKMYFLQGEHNPPHIHAIYNEDVAAIDYMTGDVLEGYLPPKAPKMVREWIEINRSEIQKIWETQEVKQLPPLE